MSKRRNRPPGIRVRTVKDYFRYPDRPVRRGELLQLLHWYDRRRKLSTKWKRFWRWLWYSLVPPKDPSQAAADDVQPHEVLEHSMKEGADAADEKG